MYSSRVDYCTQETDVDETDAQERVDSCTQETDAGEIGAQETDAHERADYLHTTRTRENICLLNGN